MNKVFLHTPNVWTKVFLCIKKFWTNLKVLLCTQHGWTSQACLAPIFEQTNNKWFEQKSCIWNVWKNDLCTQNVWIQIFLCIQHVWTKKMLHTQNVWTKVLLCTQNVWTKVLLCTQNVWTKVFLWVQNIWTKSCFASKIFMFMFDPFISTSFCHNDYDRLHIFKLHELGFIQFMSTLNYFIKERTKPCIQNVWTKVLVCAQNVWKKSLALHLKCLNKHLSSHSNIMFEQKSCLSKCLHKCSPTVHAGFVWHAIHGSESKHQSHAVLVPAPIHAWQL